MPSLSVFQKPPLLIAENIVRFYLNKHGHLNDSAFIDDAAQSNAWLVLYDISRFWRMLAVERFCSEVKLEITADATGTPFTFPHLPQSVAHSIKYHRFVKRVNLTFVDINKHPRESQHQSYLNAWPESILFPSARMLNICIEDDPYQSNSKAFTLESTFFDWISQRIPTALPKLQEAHIKHLFSGHIPDYVLDLAMKKPPNALFLAILNRVKRLVINARPVCFIANDAYMQINPSLASLDFNCMDDVDLFLSIVRISAPSLVHLKVRAFAMSDMRLFVFGNSKKPLIFPRLEKLDFENVEGPYKVNRVRVNKPTVIFPLLRRLKWRGPYAFEDDTLFRGNNNTLELLDLCFGSDLSDMLRRENTFASDRYPKLCCIFAHTSSDSNLEHASFDLHMEFAAKLVSAATRVFWTDIPSSYQKFASAISTPNYIENIQHLAMETTTLTLLQFLRLIEAFPNMTDLTCSFVRIDPEFYPLTHSELIHHFTSLYDHPLSRSLKYWTIPHANLVPKEPLTIAAAILLLVCPNFVEAASTDRKAFWIRRDWP